MSWVGYVLWLTRIHYSPNPYLLANGSVVKFAFDFCPQLYEAKYQRVVLVHITCSETWTQELQLSLQYLYPGSTCVEFYGPGLALFYLFALLFIDLVFIWSFCGCIDISGLIDFFFIILLCKWVLTNSLQPWLRWQ